MVVQCADEVCNENIEIPVAVPGTRSSARIKQLKIKEEAKKASRSKTVGDSQNLAVNKTKKSNNKRRKLDAPLENAQHRNEGPTASEHKDNVDANAVFQSKENGSLNDKSDSARVTETLRIFNKHYLHFVQVRSFSSLFYAKQQELPHFMVLDFIRLVLCHCR